MMVFIGTIAKKAPVDKWFTRTQFSIFTRISYASSKHRLKVLTDGGFLKKKKDEQSWMMTSEMKRGMLAQEHNNETSRQHKAKKYVKKPTGRLYVKDVKLAEVMAYKEAASRLLNSLGFL